MDEIASRRRGSLRGRKAAAPSDGGFQAGMSGPRLFKPERLQQPSNIDFAAL